MVRLSRALNTVEYGWNVNSMSLNQKMTMDEVLAAVQRVFGTFRCEHQATREELAAAEARLGLRLPGAVRDMYLKMGWHPLHSTANELVPLAELYVERECLIFYIEEQRAEKWGIPLSEMHAFDPPVATTVVSDKVVDIEMQLEFESLSQFLACQVAWQAIGGGMPFVGVILTPMVFGDSSVSLPKSRVSRSSVVSLGEKLVDTEQVQVWYCNGGIVVTQLDGYIGLATESEQRFLELGNVLGVRLGEWDYATLRDE